MTTMTKRSHHIPTFTKMEMIQIATVFCRTRGDQRNCVTTTLQNICSQKATAFGPAGRATKNW